MMEYAWLIPVMPAIAFFFLATAGRRLPNWSAIAATGTMAAGFIIFWFVLADWLSMESLPAVKAFGFSIDWMKAGGSTFTWGMVIDPISLVMLGLVTFVALLVQIYSLGYMAGDKRMPWYFAVHSLFAAAMLLLVLADDLVLMFVAWEATTLCSFFLIARSGRDAREPAIRTLLVTAAGGLSLLAAVVVMWVGTGTTRITAHEPLKSPLSYVVGRSI